MDSTQGQANYYTGTAADYEAAHFRDRDEHYVALEYARGLFRTLGVSSVLDIGAGTGRASEFLARHDPSLRLVEVEPVEALLAVSRSRAVAAQVRATGHRLPFRDQTFDAVCATGVLHHVADPTPVIREMTRVARRLVVVSDANRFGQGPVLARLAKFSLCRFGLWPLIQRVRSRGRGYLYSEGDGIFYSYSVYDSLPVLSQWADRISLLGTGTGNTGLTGPLFSSPSVMLAAIREPKGDFARSGP